MTSLLLNSCDSFATPEERVVVQVGQRRISEAVLKRDDRKLALEMGIGDQPIELYFEPLMRRVVEQYLVLEYGREEGIEVAEGEFQSALKEVTKEYSKEDFDEILLKGYIDLDEWKQSFREQLLLKKILERFAEGMPPVSFQEIQGYYEARQDEFRHPEMVKFRQIVTRTMREAQEVEDLLSQGKDMGSLAKERSIAPEAGQGGEVGWVARGELEESMERMLFSQPPGKASPVLRTSNGYHVFEVLSRRPEGVKSLSEAMAEIEERLYAAKEKAYYGRRLEELRERYPVEVDEKLLHSVEFR